MRGRERGDLVVGAARTFEHDAYLVTLTLAPGARALDELPPTHVRPPRAADVLRIDEDEDHYTSIVAVRRPAPGRRGPRAWNGSGSRLLSRQSATYSASAGPCLKPCPEPPPTSHQSLRSGCRATTKWASGVRSYWQTRAPTRGASASAGKRRAAY